MKNEKEFVQKGAKGEYMKLFKSFCYYVIFESVMAKNLDSRMLDLRMNVSDRIEKRVTAQPQLNIERGYKLVKM